MNRAISRRALQTHNVNVIEKPYSLDVLKDGVVLETLELKPTADQTFYLCGRQADVCDIEMAHGSISRVHAVLQYNSDGALMMQDLQSAQVHLRDVMDLSDNSNSIPM